MHPVSRAVRLPSMWDVWDRTYAWQESLDLCMWQAPSLALMVAVTGNLKTAVAVTGNFKTKVGRELLQCISDAPFRTLCAESLSGFVDGRLPGDLGDNPEAVDLGEGVGWGRLVAMSSFQRALQACRVTGGTQLVLTPLSPWGWCCRAVPGKSTGVLQRMRT